MPPHLVDLTSDLLARILLQHGADMGRRTLVLNRVVTYFARLTYGFSEAEQRDLIAALEAFGWSVEIMPDSPHDLVLRVWFRFPDDLGGAR